MKTFVINLVKDKDRRALIKQQLNNINFSYEFINAVYGKELSKEELSANYNNAKAMRTQCRPLTLSEIGCALSHIKVYQKMIKENIQTALILEDDARIPDDLSEILINIEKHIEASVPEVILLSPVELIARSSKVTKINNIYNLTKFKKRIFNLFLYNKFIRRQSSSKRTISNRRRSGLLEKIKRSQNC